MDKALFIAMSGAKQDMQAMQLRANNLANVSTTGFRADLEQARSMQAFGDGLPTRVFSMVERPGFNSEEGSINTTGRDLDIAIKGQGWIGILDNQGQEGYSRVGNLQIDPTGLLVNGRGHQILGNGDAPIILPVPIDKIQIAEDGTISVLPQGAPAEAMEVVDRIKLVDPPKNEIFKDANGVFKPIVAGTIFEPDANVNVVSGALERSNVNAVGEMTSLIDLQRQFEMQVKLMKTAEEMDQATDSLLSMRG